MRHGGRCPPRPSRNVPTFQSQNPSRSSGLSEAFDPRETQIWKRLRSNSCRAAFDREGSGCYHQSAGWSSLVARWAHNPKVAGSNPAPATKLILLNHKGQRVSRWPFILFIPCTNVQNFRKCICNSAFVCLDCVRVAHRGLRFGMPQPILPDCHWRPDLIEQRGIAMPESMETIPTEEARHSAAWDSTQLNRLHRVPRVRLF